MWKSFVSLCDESPDSVAIASTDASFTYEDLREIIPRLASWLVDNGVESNHRVAINLPTLPHSLFSLSLYFIGACSASWVSLDAARRDEIDYVVTAASERVSGIKNILLPEDWFFEIYKSNHISEYPREPESLARIVYSSGTTGTPKGVGFSFANLEQRVKAAKRNWITYQPFMSLLDVNTVSGMQTLFAQISSGETYFLPVKPEHNYHVLSQWNVKAIKASPMQLRALLEHCSRNGLKLPALSLAQGAGGFTPRKLAERFAKYFSCDFVNLYGSTETGTVSVRHGFESDEQLMGQLVSEAEVEIFDEEGNLLPSGVSGKVRVRTKNMASGYISYDAQATQLGFSEGWFYPGDIGFLQGKELFITGRQEDLVNFGGLKYSLSFLDGQLQELPGVNDAAVVDIVDSYNQELLAICIAGTTTSPEKVVAHLRAHIAAEIRLAVVDMELIPRTRTAKVDRNKLRELAQGLYA